MTSLSCLTLIQPPFQLPWKNVLHTYSDDIPRKFLSCYSPLECVATLQAAREGKPIKMGVVLLKCISGRWHVCHKTRFREWVLHFPIKELWIWIINKFISLSVNLLLKSWKSYHLPHIKLLCMGRDIKTAETKSWPVHSAVKERKHNQEGIKMEKENGVHWQCCVSKIKQPCSFSLQLAENTYS